jgi:hypothetical protein
MGNELLARRPDPSRFVEAPETMALMSWTDIYSIPSPDVQAFQLRALRNRFHQQTNRVNILRRLAAEQRIHDIGAIEDGAPLLLRHSDYKSYPISLIEKGRFDRMTEWLSELTSYDLSGIDASKIDTIDDWLSLLDRETDLRVATTSGTSGKLSFLPKSEAELPTCLIGLIKCAEGFGSEPNAGLIDNPSAITYIFPGHRYGTYGGQRYLDGFVKYLYDGDESKVIALNPGRLSADAVSLNGRLRIAESKGELGRMQLSDKLLARQKDYMREQEQAPARITTLLSDLDRRLRGRRCMGLSPYGAYYDFAVEGKRLGIRGLFASDSLFTFAGGMKTRVLPEGFIELIKDFLGVKALGTAYGMSEMTSMFPMCPEGRYHIPPWIIPYLLDPETGVPFPRSGTHTGRFGVIDVCAQTYWGGFLSGDEVTISWGDTEPCACGRLGAYLHSGVRRYSEKQGGDDKITCAGAPHAIDKAMSFITELTSDT